METITIIILIVIVAAIYLGLRALINKGVDGLFNSIGTLIYNKKRKNAPPPAQQNLADKFAQSNAMNSNYQQLQNGVQNIQQQYQQAPQQYQQAPQQYQQAPQQYQQAPQQYSDPQNPFQN